jgi:hypothetical protein
MHAQNKILFATKMCIIGSDADTQVMYLNFLTVWSILFFLLFLSSPELGL